MIKITRKSKVIETKNIIKLLHANIVYIVLKTVMSIPIVSAIARSNNQYNHIFALIIGLINLLSTIIAFYIFYYICLLFCKKVNPVFLNSWRNVEMIGILSLISAFSSTITNIIVFNWLFFYIISFIGCLILFRASEVWVTKHRL